MCPPENTMRISLEDLRRVSTRRPPGYSEHVLSMAESTDAEFYYICTDKWAQLREFYQRKSDAIPRDQWPRKFQRLAKKAIPTDRGVGDILQRRYARWGGELYKKLLANLWISCGCQSDQDRLNTLYPLP